MAFVSVDQLLRLLRDLPKSLRLDAAAVEESALVLMRRTAAIAERALAKSLVARM